jgi:hypothetical protein
MQFLAVVSEKEPGAFDFTVVHGLSENVVSMITATSIETITPRRKTSPLPPFLFPFPHSAVERERDRERGREGQEGYHLQKKMF